MDATQWIRFAAAIGHWHFRHQPGQQLPVAAHPAMRAAHERYDRWRVLFEQHNVGGQSNRAVHAFKQVMAEQRVFRYAVAERLLDRAPVVDAFAGKDAVAEQIMIGV